MTDGVTLQPAQADPIRILLVEDDPADALLFRQMLSLPSVTSFRLEHVSLLSDAVHRVAAGETDIVILDLSLPDSHGFDTFATLREAIPKVPIIVFTGLNDEEMAIRTVHEGSQDYLVKGQVSGPLLVRVVRYAVERHRIQAVLAEKHDLLRCVIDNIPDQVYLKDADSRFVSVNPVTARFFGASSSDEIAGKSDFDFFPHDLAAQFLAEEQALLRRNQPCINREASITGADGQTRWVITSKVPMRNRQGHITGLLGINRDITEIKRAEYEIKEYQNHLQDLVEARTAELKNANARLEDQDKARVEFVSNVSHELKTPLTALKFALDNMINGAVGEVSDACRSYLHMMRDSCQRLQKTIEDILDMTKLDTSTLRLNGVRVPLSMLIRQVAGSLQTQMDAKFIRVSLSVPDRDGFIECDRQRMERVVFNVLANAIKFTFQGGEIRVSLRSDPAEAGFLVLEIEDDGVGIPQEHIAHIGERYFQGNREANGTGLGLSISREILKLHGGTLSLASPPPDQQRGTLVTIRLPAVEPPELMLIGAGEPCQTIAAQLACQGYGAPVYVDGSEALAAMRRAAPYAVILDFSMAGLESAGVIVQIKDDPDLQNVPLIAITEACLPPTKREILAGFAIHSLRSPWHTNDLLTSIEQAVLGSRR